jgi:hypothetical protein
MKPAINYLAVLVAALVQFVLGALWYSPALFINKWMEATGVTADMGKQMTGGQMAMNFGGSFVAYLVCYYVMAHFVQYAGAKTAKDGAQTGFWLWLGFVATTILVNVIYQMKPISLFFIDGGHTLISFLAGGIILAIWQKKTA